MAPPANRRSGYSRRAQYTTFFSYAAGVLGVVLGAALLIISTHNPRAFAGVRAMAADAVQPAGAVTASTRTGTHGFVATIRGYFQAGSQNIKLRRELQEAKTRLVEADAIAAENRRLKAMLGLATKEPRPVTFARLTGSTASSSRRFATLGAGATDGVEVGMPVISPMGLVGRVLETGRITARVMLVSDTESVVPVRRSSDGLPAFAQGRGDGTLQLRLINLGVNPIRKGDTFVTSGTGGLYRPDIPIAIVTAITTDGGIARVLSEPAATNYVSVEHIWEPGEDAVKDSVPDESKAP